MKTGIGKAWFVVESGGDGAEAVLVYGDIQTVKAELKRQMWADDSEPSDDVKADIDRLDDDDYWTCYYPNYELFTWKLDFEDGYVRVQKLTQAPNFQKAGKIIDESIAMVEQAEKRAGER